MFVVEGVVTLWRTLNVRDNTLCDYKQLYKRSLHLIICFLLQRDQILQGLATGTTLSDFESNHSDYILN